MVLSMLAVGDVFEEHYIILKSLGHGGMGTVYLATDNVDGSSWAIKEEKITTQNRKLLFSEAEILKKLDHPAFPKFRDKKEIGGYLYLIMEYIDGHTLESEMKEKKRISEGQAVEWFAQICSALVYLHGLDSPIVYRDFKPSNLMIENTGRIRIIDLGIAQEYQGSGAEVDIAVLTRGYAAPEQYNKRYKLDSRTDIYALAVTVHYMLTGKDPNEPPYVFVPVRKLRSDLSVAVEYILKKCLQPNPNKRYSSATLLLYDIEHIKELDRKIRLHIRSRRIAACLLISLAVIASVAVYSVNLGAQRREIESYNALIESARDATSLNNALQDIQNAINLSPENPEAYILCAELYLDYGLVEDAYTYMNDIIISQFPDIYNNTDFLELVQKLDKVS